MIEIGLNKISKNYGFEQVLKDISFEIKTGERVALVGDNGSGKTTILNIISKNINADSGVISIRKNAVVGYLKQIPDNLKEDLTVKELLYQNTKDLMKLKERLDSLEEKITNATEKEVEKLIVKYSNLQTDFINMGGYEIDANVEKVIKGFKINKELLERNFNSLSGGEKTIISLASIIIAKPDILLLDEPTNHLDIDTLEWLEEYLRNYKGTVLMVSHDRYFLDAVSTKTILIENGNTIIFHGNYTYYLKENEARIFKEFKDYKDQQKQIKAMEESIKRLEEYGAIAKNEMFFKRAENIRKRLERMDKLEKPQTKKALPLEFSGTRSSKKVLSLTNINISFPEKNLLKNASLDIMANEKVCLLGPNGCGKSSLIKYILKYLNEKETNLKVGYISQELFFSHPERTIFEEARASYIGEDSHLRAALSKFHFYGDNIYKRIKNLSGGEKVRLKLFLLMQENINFLILDEPTNHIDIETKEILETSLNNYPHTILFISHDRYFINNVATRVIYFSNKSLKTTPGNYEDYKRVRNFK